MAARFPLEVVITGVDRITAPLKRTQEKVAKAFEPLRRLNNSLAGLKEAAGFDRIATAAGNAGKRLRDVGSEARAFATTVAASAGIAAGAIAAVVNGYARQGEELLRLSDKLQVPIETLQELRHAARLSNVEDGALEQGLSILNRTVGQAASGTGKGAAAFRRLGIDIKDATGKLRPSTDLLPEIADKLNALEDPMRRAALTAAIFGRSGSDLTPLLKGGSQAMADAADEARRLGIVMSDADARAGDAFTDSLVRLQAVVGGVRNAIGKELLPVVAEIIRSVQDWLVTHRGEITAYARAIAEKIPGVLASIRDLLVEVAQKLRPVISLVKVLADRFGGANVAIAAVAVLIGGKLLVSIALLVPSLIQLGTVLATTIIPTLWTLVSAIVTGVIPALVSLAVAFFATPIGWIVAGIAAVIAAAVLLWKNWDKVSAFLVGVWKRVRDGFVKAFGWIVDNVPWVLGPVALIVKHWGTLKAFFEGLWGGIRDVFADTVAWISTKVQELLGILPDWMIDLFRNEGPVLAPGARAAPAAVGGAGAGASSAGNASVVVSFENLPKGTRVRPDEASGVDLDLSMGYALGSS